jgi:hypothetical protein
MAPRLTVRCSAGRRAWPAATQSLPRSLPQSLPECSARSLFPVFVLVFVLVFVGAAQSLARSRASLPQLPSALPNAHCRTCTAERALPNEPSSGRQTPRPSGHTLEKSASGWRPEV